MDDIAGLGVRGMALRLAPGHQHYTTTPKAADPDVVIAVDVQAPRYIDRPAAGEAQRRGWVPSGRIMLITPGGLGYFSMASPRSRNCSMMDAPSGTFGSGKSRDMLLATQTLPFESNARARTLIPALKDSTLDGSSAGNRTTMSDWE